MTIIYHQPVLVKEVVEYLKVKKGKKFIDATLGDGGHAIAIAKNGGKVLGIDWDLEAINRARQRINQDRQLANKIIVRHSNFIHLKEVATEEHFEVVDGILFDLGVATHQLMSQHRGFSLYKEGPLDMRMDRRQKLTALDIVNKASEEELYEIFTKNAEEHRSLAIAQAIIRTRSLKGKIKTTRELADLVAKVVDRKGRSGIHPATQIFQALRIEVNKELSNIKKALPQAVQLLARGGRLAILTYHSGEDRIVKLFLRNEKQLTIVTKHPIRPSIEEIKKNKRARSALLRVGERI